MDTFTIVLIVLGIALAITVVLSQVRGRRRAGHHIAQNAPMDGDDGNTARYTSRTNIHNHNDFGGTAGGL